MLFIETNDHEKGKNRTRWMWRSFTIDLNMNGNVGCLASVVFLVPSCDTCIGIETVTCTSSIHSHDSEFRIANFELIKISIFSSEMHKLEIFWCPHRSGKIWIHDLLQARQVLYYWATENLYIYYFVTCADRLKSVMAIHFKGIQFELYIGQIPKIEYEDIIIITAVWKLKNSKCLSNFGTLFERLTL